MKKLKVFYNFREEENWLSEMAKNGYILQNYSTAGVYSFLEEKPQSLKYKVDYRFFAKKRDFNSYIALFEDAGWKHICGTQNSGNHYFLPENSQADAEIFSDEESANRRYRILFKICVFNFVFLAIATIMTMNTYDFKLSNMGFLTPGLWDKTGEAFWKSFFFELPFAAGRILGFLFLLVMGILYGYWAMKVKSEYDCRTK